jgi:phage terminase large subunit-like protein
MAGNVVLDEDSKYGGIKPEKIGKNNNMKIDGISALLCAWHRMLEGPKESVYNNRGILFV